MTASDIYSFTNPALCSLILWSFVQGFEQENKNGCEVPLIFLPLPIILSGSTRAEFFGTNVKTGLLAWIARKPKVLINIGEKIEKVSKVTREALIFGCSNGIFSISDNGNIQSGIGNIKHSGFNNLTSSELKEMFSVAKRLGAWCGQMKSTTTIFYSMGITI